MQTLNAMLGAACSAAQYFHASIAPGWWLFVFAVVLGMLPFGWEFLLREDVIAALRKAILAVRRKFPRGKVDTVRRKMLAALWRFFRWRDDRLDLQGDNGFFGHLDELRERLVRILSWMIASFLLFPPLACWSAQECGATLLFWFTGAGKIYEIMAAPMVDVLKSETGSIIAIGAYSPVKVPIAATFFVTVCAMMPYTLHVIWGFVAPGLYSKEIKIVWPIVATGAALFYAGIAFSYYVVFPIVFDIVAQITPDTVTWSPDIGELFGSMLVIFFAFGLVFEIPVVEFVLIRMGVVELEDVKKARPFVIVGAFVLAAIVTPPDILSQFLLAVPCWLLYELGLWFAAIWGVKKEEEEEDSSGELSEVAKAGVKESPSTN